MNRDPHQSTIESSACFFVLCMVTVISIIGAFFACMHYALEHATEGQRPVKGVYRETCKVYSPTPMQHPIIQPGMQVECRVVLPDGSTVTKVGM